MHTAYLLISAETGHAESVLRALEKIDAVEEAYMVYGTYDIIAKINTDSMEKLKDIIINVRHVGKVQSTQSMVVVGETE